MHGFLWLDSWLEACFSIVVPLSRKEIAARKLLAE